MRLRTILRGLCPPVLARLFLRWRHGVIVYRAGFSDWQAAKAASGGYAHDAIIERVVAATDAVVAGRAAAERDGVILDRLQPPFHLLAPMLAAALEREGRLVVVDFGGALGTLYRQCRPLLGSVRRLRWHVVEQAAFARIGHQNYENDELAFFDSLQAACAAEAPDVVLMSSVLQFLPDVAPVLSAVTSSGARYLLVDRTPFRDAPQDAVFVQEVPPSIYAASYPMRAFSLQLWFERLGANWTLLHEQPSPEGRVHGSDGSPFDYRYQLFRKASC